MTHAQKRPTSTPAVKLAIHAISTKLLLQRFSGRFFYLIWITIMSDDDAPPSPVPPAAGVTLTPEVEQKIEAESLSPSRHLGAIVVGGYR